MSAFRDMVETDRTETFLDMDMFADRHKIDGRQITCIFEDDISHAKGGISEYGIAERQFVLFGLTEDLPKRKTFGSGMSIDGRQYLVTDWMDEIGITKITLTSAEGM